MIITVKSAPISIDKKAVTRDIIRSVNIIWRGAIKAGVMQILADNRIVVDTGMAKSSLIPLARAGKFATEFAATIIPKSPPRQGYTSINGKWDFFIGKKGPESGEEAGEEGTIVRLGTKTKPTWSLKYTIMVFHYRLHESGLAQLASWRTLSSFEKGFVVHIQKSIDDGSFDPKLLKIGRLR